MKEAGIRKKAIDELKREGYICWYPLKVKYQETDIFGVFDAICIKDSDLRFIQWTSLGNISTRKKKIERFFKENNVFIACEVWGYNGETKIFKKVYI